MILLADPPQVAKPEVMESVKVPQPDAVVLVVDEDVVGVVVDFVEVVVVVVEVLVVVLVVVVDVVVVGLLETHFKSLSASGSKKFPFENHLQFLFPG